ncbi:hypothetical protein AB0A05_07705 [Streptomyces sp. NPDC046374]|uniref:hypothetical protein n=1 Tax=Streptomyces sp. NPDC046374 TaxID=3154917 RepID=UPI0033E94D86
MARTPMVDHKAVAEAAKAAPGEWQHAGVYQSTSVASMANAVRRATRLKAYAPGGAFEAYHARVEDGEALWVRYVAWVADLEPRPLGMSYRVCDRGSTRGYTGVGIVTVDVAAECPTCGGPRGKAVAYRFCEDGEWYTVDRWTNLCGHLDHYDAVLKEHRGRQEARDAEEQREAARALRAGPAPAGPFTGAVVLLNSAAAETRGLTARQAAQFLGRHGHHEAADLIEEELTRQAGQRWSARKAAVYLAERGAARAAEFGGDAPDIQPVAPPPAPPKAIRDMPRDPRPIGVVAEARIAASDQPARFRACMSDALKAVERGDDPATAAWTATDRVGLAAEIEALAGLRRLSSTSKDAK